MQVGSSYQELRSAPLAMTFLCDLSCAAVAGGAKPFFTHHMSSNGRAPVVSQIGTVVLASSQFSAKLSYYPGSTPVVAEGSRPPTRTSGAEPGRNDPKIRS